MSDGITDFEKQSHEGLQHFERHTKNEIIARLKEEVARLRYDNERIVELTARIDYLERQLRGSKLSDDKADKVFNRVCPDCGAMLVDGPCGGLSIMVSCTVCRARFVDQFVFGVERV